MAPCLYCHLLTKTSIVSLPQMRKRDKFAFLQQGNGFRLSWKPGFDRRYFGGRYNFTPHLHPNMSSCFHPGSVIVAESWSRVGRGQTLCSDVRESPLRSAAE